MELGGFCDDGLFEETRNRKTRPTLTSYNAKICQPQWFNEETTYEDPLMEMQLHKHRSDWAYRCRDYHAALHHYQATIALLPPSNHTMLRDMLESVTRCYLGLGQPEDALISLQKLELLALSYDQKTGYLRLAALVYRSLARQEDELLALQKTLWLHPMLCDVWACLARLYMEQLHHPAPPNMVDTPAPPVTANESQTVAAPSAGALSADLDALTLRIGAGDLEAIPAMDLRHAACTCLVRARALAGCVRKQPEFVTRRYRDMYGTLNEQIQHLKIEEDVIKACLLHVTVDLQGDADMSRPSEGRSEADLVVEIEDDGFLARFQSHWFSWR